MALQEAEVEEVGGSPAVAEVLPRDIVCAEAREVVSLREQKARYRSQTRNAINANPTEAGR